MIRRIAINTGGGDAPGLNAVIGSVALSALNHGWEVLGIRNGYEGIIESDPEAIIKLDREQVGGIFRMGVWGGTNGTLFPHYPEIKKENEAASDHAAIWADLGI